MKNKGFTLIELLAVIVILAIIALIATPVILNIIDDARTGAYENSAKLIVSTVEKSYAGAYMANDGKTPSLTAVQTQFAKDMPDAKWETGKITAEGVECTVTGSNAKDNLVVDCHLTGETTSIAKTNSTMTLG
ncbi:MAG: prepilin-type N-terminal cleavage/methylation domain-containing protein [Bacilli bacterium]|nr:prepilin-type N-terminal cleavage/methylation domain-containing protein [Bacilli bacterium]